MAATNCHATLVVVGQSGLLIAGASGSGKTALALGLLSYAQMHGVFSSLVSDDQVFLQSAGTRLIGRAPEAIKGLMEARFYGPVRVRHEPRAVIDLVARLVDIDQAPRVQDEEWCTLEGVELPCLVLPDNQHEIAIRALAARLSLPPFSRNVL